MYQTFYPTCPLTPATKRPPHPLPNMPPPYLLPYMPPTLRDPISSTSTCPSNPPPHTCPSAPPSPPPFRRDDASSLIKQIHISWSSCGGFVVEVATQKRYTAVATLPRTDLTRSLLFSRSCYLSDPIYYLQIPSARQLFDSATLSNAKSAVTAAISSPNGKEIN